MRERERGRPAQIAEHRWALLSSDTPGHTSRLAVVGTATRAGGDADRGDVLSGAQSCREDQRIAARMIETALTTNPTSQPATS